MVTTPHPSSDSDTAAAAPSPQATRVESLFHLVKAGSSPDVRTNAAEKLGEIALQSPVYCRSILQQIRLLVVDPDWDVRVAAAQCLSVIARSLQSSSDNVALRFAHASFAGREASCPRLNFRTVAIQKVLEDGAPLLRSGGDEYQYESNLSDDQRRVAAVRQRLLLLRRICGASSSDGLWCSQEDALAQQMLPRLNSEHVKELAADIEASEATAATTAAGVDFKQEEDEQDNRKRAGELLPTATTTKRTKSYAAQDHQDNEDDHDDPESLDLVALLVVDLFESVFDAKWEIRHGSLACLRHILLSSGWIAGLQRHQSEMAHAELRIVDQWIEECLMRCLCVLALDQFVDYSADGSVAPVRELSAQVLGILLGSLHDPALLQQYLSVLRELLVSSSWHACHGGLLGIKYLLQAHASHASSLVPLVIHDVVSSLRSTTSERNGNDTEDLVVVASGILGDVVHSLEAVDPSTIQSAAEALWAIVTGSNHSGLSATTAIETLRLWYSNAHISKVLHVQRDPLVMWSNLVHVVPLLHHHGSSIRVAAASCIAALANQEATGSTMEDTQLKTTLQYLLPHLLLQLLRDDDERVRTVLASCWRAVVQWCFTTQRALVATAVESDLLHWIELLWSFDNVSALNTPPPSQHDDECMENDDDVTLSVSLSLPSKENLAARVAFADALGLLVSLLPVDSRVYTAVTTRVHQALASLSGDQQCGALLVLARWACHAKRRVDPAASESLSHVQDQFGPVCETMAKRDWVPLLVTASSSSQSSFYYAEQMTSLKRVVRMQASLVEIFASAGIRVTAVAIAPSSPSSSSSSCVSVATLSRQIAENIAQFPYSALHAQPLAFEQAHFRRQDLFLVDDLVQQAFTQSYARIQGVGSCAFCELLTIPPKKSGFLVKSLMESIKCEANTTFQSLTAETLARFVVSQCRLQLKCVTKIISNLCNSAVAMAYQASDVVAIDPATTTMTPQEQEDALEKLRVRVRGAESALQAIARMAVTMESAVFESLPLLSEVGTRGWSKDSGEWTDKLVQENAHLVAVLAPALSDTKSSSAATATTMRRWIHELCALSSAAFQVEQTRRAVARAVATVCCAAFASSESSDNDDDDDRGEDAMEILYEKLFSSTVADQQLTLIGAVMVLDQLVVLLSAKLTPYVPSLVRFAMQAMHAPQSHVRSMAAKTFADLLPLLPLQMDLQVKATRLQQVQQDNQSARTFLESLLVGKAIEHVAVDAVLTKSMALRDYQHHGVNWLTFLTENRMGGVLADDMGLGKTIQVLATIAAWAQRSQQSRTSGNHVSLVVCPPIIVHHWIAEAQRCLPSVFAQVIDYSGPAATRKALLAKSSKSVTNKPTLMVTTYAITRTDRELLSAMVPPFEFLVLDEAHLIRNPKSALFQAVCSLQASHRFVLSGTPLQNHVGDLWSLFSFLMPGYLGEYADFRRDFELPISKSRERTATPKQKEQAALAINSLHQRVLPFILRRTKDHVLKELPPKIISNVLLALTPLQQRLYKAASRRQQQQQRTEPAPDDAAAVPLAGVLRNLQLLKKICVHPSLVKDTELVTTKDRKAMGDWKQSGKMVGLHDLLVESCDLGTANDTSAADDDALSLGGRSSHRCLVFAHFKETLDVIEDMFTRALPRLRHVRLDGTTPAARRQQIVRRFNDDPTIDVLLLTTAVGGLGLTLTGADTVIFVEHSWNPFVDLQAMDRAHRIGQKKTVRVFRLIMETTLEEHIMDLQAFKQRVASTVVTTADATTSMDANTTNVLQLLQTSSTAVKAQEAAAALERTTDQQQVDQPAMIPGVAAELLQQIGELWDQSQYDSLAFPGI